MKWGPPLTLCPKQCTLGVFPDPDSDKFLYTFLQESLFMARLLISQTWLRAPPPTVQDWIAAVNAVLLCKKELYTHRGCPAKYCKIWDTWLEKASTCTKMEAGPV